MINRKDFIRNTLMAFAVTLVPKILQPCIPNVPKLISGWFVVAKEMMNDLPYLQAYIPMMLKKEMSRVEGFDPNKEITIQMSNEHGDCFVQNTIAVIGTQFI
jgi:hypothetical protein